MTDIEHNDELLELRSRLAAAEAQLAEYRRTRLGIAARLIRAAARDPLRRKSLLKDLARAFLDKSANRIPGSGIAGSRLPFLEIPEGPVTRPELRVAVLLDGFSELAFRYEWNQVTFTPENWREVLTAEAPQLLFVESAWNGNGGSWRLHMTSQSAPSEELRALVEWCRTQEIPTVFWNKEDPPNYSRFIETAKLFDHVFTVDGAKLPQYEADLGHDRIGLLPFAAQPRIHNPIRRGAGRIYDVAFAGTYFAEKHPERREQMEYVLGPAVDFGLHIYSRMQTGDKRYRFPARYKNNIVGSLPYEQMLSAYTSYKVFLNVNSVIESKSMCSRRLFELSAAQTAVVTAPAASVPEFFGDDIEVVTSANDTAQSLSALVRHDEFRDRMALRAHRRVFERHLYAHRVDTVLSTVGLPVAARDRSVSVIVPTNRPDQLDSVFDFIGRQSHGQVQLILVQHGFSASDVELKAKADASGVADFRVLTAESSLTLGACMNLGLDVADGTYVAKMDDDNFYGAHYLSDLVHAFDYTDAEVVGKWAHLVHLEGSKATLLRFPYAEHRYVDLVQGGTILARRSTAAELRFEDLPRRVDTTFLDKVRSAGGKVYSSDRFNFVSIRRADVTAHTWKVSEEQLLAGKAKLLFYGDPSTHAEV